MLSSNYNKIKNKKKELTRSLVQIFDNFVVKFLFIFR